MNKGYEELMHKNAELKQELAKNKEINGALMHEIRDLRRALAAAHREQSKLENELADIEANYYKEDNDK